MLAILIIIGAIMIRQAILLKKCLISLDSF